MKKTLALFLALVILLALCACGNDDTQATVPSTDPSQAATSSTQAPTNGTVADTEASTDASTEASTQSPTSAPTEAPTKVPTEAPDTPPSACDHNYKAATCSDPQTCSKCGTTKGKALGHSYKDATCTDPKTCSKCGATKGKALGHSYKDATCTAPKTCSKCGATKGKALSHSYKDGTCTGCGAADPNVPFTNNVWTTYIEKVGTGEEGNILSVYSLNPTDFQGYTHKEYYSNADYSSVNNGSIKHNGKTYYDFWFSAEMNGIEWDDDGDTVKVTFAYSEPVVELVLTRTGEKEFTVKSSNDTENIPVGTVFTTK